MATPDPHSGAVPAMVPPLSHLLETAPPTLGAHAGSRLAPHEAFRRARVRALGEGAVHGPLTPGPLLVLHLLPLELECRHLALAPLRDDLRHAVSVPGTSWSDSRHNADGLAVVADHVGRPGAPGPGGLAGAIQWFRSGGLEVASTACVAPAGATAYRVPVLWGTTLVTLLKDDVRKALQIFRERCGLEGAFAVTMALVGMQGVRLADESSWMASLGPGIDRPLVLTPWYIIEPSADGVDVCRQLADLIWQSAGLAEPSGALWGQ